MNELVCLAASTVKILLIVLTFANFTGLKYLKLHILQCIDVHRLTDFSN